MNITAAYSFSAAPPEVWKLLSGSGGDQVVPSGCRELRPVGDDRYHAEMTIGVAAVSGSFTATVALSEQLPPQSYRLSVDATGSRASRKARR